MKIHCRFLLLWGRRFMLLCGTSFRSEETSRKIRRKRWMFVSLSEDHKYFGTYLEVVLVLVIRNCRCGHVSACCSNFGRSCFPVGLHFVSVQQRYILIVCHKLQGKHCSVHILCHTMLYFVEKQASST